MENFVWRLAIGVIIAAATLVIMGFSSGGPFKAPEQRIAASLPKGAFLRDFKRLDRIGPEAFLVIYIEKGYEADDWYTDALQYVSCPGEIMGQAIRGKYRLAVWRGGKLIGDMEIPAAGYNLAGYRLGLVYKNIRGNIYQDLNRPDRDKLDGVPLLVMRDYTGDGRENEFLLKTTEGGCGFWDGLVAGYDEKTDRPVVYSDWIFRLNPDKDGNFKLLFECGDHGNTTRLEEWYEFDEGVERFEKVRGKETLCQGG